MLKRSLIVLASVFCLTLASAAQAGYEECDEVHPNGSFVSSKLSGLKGMVVSHWRTDSDSKTARNCQYSVRFVTTRGWVYTIEKMRPYELKTYTAPPADVPTTSIVPGDPGYVQGDQVRELDFGR